MAIERQTSTLPPAQPSYILRGHASQIHSAHFVRQNSRLLTGDAEGWVVYWNLETKRALAVWKAHAGAILGTAEWGCEKIITHGRDNNLRIWQLRAADGHTLSTILPAEHATEERPKPWLLHTLPVNTLNFCAFSMCYKQTLNQHRQDNATLAGHSVPSILSDESILIAVPGRDDKKIEVYQFPDERLKFIVPRAQSTDTGMVMAVKLVHHPTSNNVLVLAGYEGGLTAIHKLPQNEGGTALELAQLVYLSKPHSQPVLSLDVSPDGTKYFTSSADAIIAAHRIPELLSDIEEEEDLSAFEPRNFTQSSLSFDTGKQEVTANKAKLTESLPQVQSDQTLPSSVQDAEPSAELSESLDFSKKSLTSTASSTSISFAKQHVLSSQTQASKPAGLSSLLSSAPTETKHKPLPPRNPTLTVEQPHKANDTKHAGQQSLTVRSDGRLLVTGGWDSRIRIYSTKTLKEVAVLKWHKEGVYAVSFGEILGAQDLRGEKKVIDDGETMVKRETGLGKLQRQREEQMQLKHWVVAGAKDGKVSLWEVF